ncbi:MAG: hypothetical protein QOD36_377 [Mycobacterium sp.]|jgi:hypothetical protein|nr:hypothetical protein [Mycobacterium sp.]
MATQCQPCGSRGDRRPRSARVRVSREPETNTGSWAQLAQSHARGFTRACMSAHNRSRLTPVQTTPNVESCMAATRPLPGGGHAA